MVPPGKPAPLRSPAQQLADNYRPFLVEERALSPATANCWVRFIDKFLSERFGVSAFNCCELQATDVTTFVQRHAHRHCPSSAKRLVAALPSFLRYLRYKGLIEVDLDRAVPKVARWSLSSLPKHLPAAAVQRVLDSCDLETSTGRRNHAIKGRISISLFFLLFKKSLTGCIYYSIRQYLIGNRTCIRSNPVSSSGSRLI